MVKADVLGKVWYSLTNSMKKRPVKYSAKNKAMSAPRLREQVHREDEPPHRAVAREASCPDLQHPDRICERLVEFVEEHVSEACSRENPDRAVDDEAAGFLLVASAPPDLPVEEGIAAEEDAHEKQAVVAKLEFERVVTPDERGDGGRHGNECAEALGVSVLVAAGDERADAAWAEGSAMSIEEAVAYALSDDEGVVPRDRA